MTDRATFGSEFTKEVEGEVINWGCSTVKSMELMDIKDDDGSNVIANIMAQKSSAIEMESRVTVASNKQKAESSEIDARRTIELSNIDAQKITQLSGIQAKQEVETRNAEQVRIVGIAQEKAKQEVKAEAVVTMQREMEIKSVETQRNAEINKEAAKIKAEQDKVVLVTTEEGRVQQAKLKAQSTEAEASGVLKATTMQAEGIQKTGEARAAAEKALLLAPVDAQITLAKEIGGNDAYQQYLVTVRKIEAEQAVGIAQASALKEADIKVIANTGNASQGINSIGELLSSKGGQQAGAFLESLANTAEGKKLIEKVSSVVNSSN